jgi:hypothetical protein
MSRCTAFPSTTLLFHCISDHRLLALFAIAAISPQVWVILVPPLADLEFRLNSCEARWEATGAIFYEKRMLPVYKLLDTKLV